VIQRKDREAAPADHWDLDLTREIRTVVQFFNLLSCRIKPLGLPSAVHVIGLTLERSPVRG
jgi:hypothetical protein